MIIVPELEFWHWWVLGGLLVAVDAFAPGFMILWPGVAAGLVGLVVLAWPGMPLPGQLILFAVLSVASIVAWRAYRRAHPLSTDQPHLNRRGSQYLGQRFGLVQPIEHGRGRIRLGDGSWAVAGPALPAGQVVEVIDVQGTVLHVRPAVSPAPERAPDAPSALGGAAAPGSGA
ncbi:MAG: NfeD family protein [Geminicoccaceae bacterium]